jgi:hypothetical protein
MHCRSCGKQIGQASKFCTECISKFASKKAKKKSSPNIIQCQNCETEIRPNSQYCHNCGTKIEIVDIAKGGNFILWTLILFAILPATQSIVGLATAIVMEMISPSLFVNFFLVLALIVLFVFIYRGKRWAITTIGVILIVFGILNFFVMVFANSFDFSILYRIVFAALYIGIGVRFIKSKNVRAFVSSKAA